MELKVYEIDDLSNEQILAKIQARETFELKGIYRVDFLNVVNNIEGMIESEGMSCRVYTTYRSTGMLGLALSNPLTAVAGLASVVGIAAHNIATWNPDYELGKHMALGRLEITYKK